MYLDFEGAWMKWNKLNYVYLSALSEMTMMISEINIPIHNII